MDKFVEYSDAIIVAIVAAISALGGTAGGIVGVIKWMRDKIKLALEELTKKRDAFDLKVEDFNRVNDNMQKLVDALDNAVTRLEANESKTDAQSLVIDALCKCIVLLAKNNDRMIANGDADKVVELINGVQPAQVEGVKDE